MSAAGAAVEAATATAHHRSVLQAADVDVEGTGGNGGLSQTELLQHALRHNIESCLNVFVALFLCSTALIISPVFLWQHVRVLAIGTAVVMAAKTALVAATVSWFGHSWRASLAVGLTMGHVGEFSFVLLSTSTHLKILPPPVYQMLLGITALSLLATPLVIITTRRLLRSAAAGGDPLFGPVHLFTAANGGSGSGKPLRGSDRATGGTPHPRN
uniref:Cation/H+ exchanger transmembrane domain-containing protein n=1 Tax=Chlamydomonas euryale TaxID=1486919 RepID=A0A7R9Z8Y9_9CHLO